VPGSSWNEANACSWASGPNAPDNAACCCAACCPGSIKGCNPAAVSPNSRRNVRAEPWPARSKAVPACRLETALIPAASVNELALSSPASLSARPIARPAFFSAPPKKMCP